MLRAPDSQPTAAQYVKAALSNAQELGEVGGGGQARYEARRFCFCRSLSLCHFIYKVAKFSCRVD